jgi:hypothetical protein
MRTVVSGLLLLALHLHSVAAQTVRGRVVDASTRAGVNTVSVFVTASDSSKVASAVTTESGDFVLEVPRKGVYQVHFERIGYAPQATPATYLSEGQKYQLEIRLQASAITLAPVVAKVEPRVQALEQAGYYARKRFGIGKFIDRSLIDQRVGQITSEIFRGLPGMMLREKRYSRGSYVLFRSSIASKMKPNEAFCPARVFVDGLLVNPPPTEHYDFELLNLNDIEAFEIYRTADVPAQYGGADSACGVILIWRRR